MPFSRTDLLPLKRGAAHFKAQVQDLPRLAIPATRAVLAAAAGLSGLEVDTVYWITDEARLAVATSASSFTAMAKQSEAAGGAAITVKTLDFGALPVTSKTFIFAHAGALTGQNVTAGPSGKMPDGLSADELEMDGLSIAAFVSANDQITAVVTAVPGPVSGQRNFNYQLF
jgi:hypothetical protein